jgi:hypothetical protein
MKSPKPYRLRITRSAASGSTSGATYFTRDDKGRTFYFAGDETPLALSNLLGGDAAEMRFKLADAPTGNFAVDVLRHHFRGKYQHNPAAAPKVEEV